MLVVLISLWTLTVWSDTSGCTGWRPILNESKFSILLLFLRFLYHVTSHKGWYKFAVSTTMNELIELVWSETIGGCRGWVRWLQKSFNAIPILNDWAITWLFLWNLQLFSLNIFLYFAITKNLFGSWPLKEVTRTISSYNCMAAIVYRI